MNSNDENMVVSYFHPRFDCKLNASLFDLHGPSFVSSISYKSAFMDLKLSDKASSFITMFSYSMHSAGASVSFGNISSLKQWQHRKLTFMGKIVIIKKVVLPKLIFPILHIQIVRRIP